MKNETWAIKDAPNSIAEGDYHIITRTLLAHRGVFAASEVISFLSPDYDTHTHDPYLFVQMPLAIERIRLAVDDGETIGIFGDHDVDGISGATLLADVCDKLEIPSEVYIPSKHGDGHGINRKAIDLFVEAGVSLMISVDCGISNSEEVAYARTHDIETIIIDHHHVPETLPDAVAIINPQMPESGYPFADLSGTGCAFKVVQAIYSEFFPDDTEQLKWLLDVVSVATVADCMPLLGENRVFTRYGLMVLEKSRRPGYQEMIRIGEIGKYDGHINAETIAFQIAPRLNAAGRMGEARDAYELLREKDSAMAAVRASDLEEKNIKRREITATLTKKAEKEVKEKFSEAPFIFIVGEDYPIGIVGIIAGKIAQKHQKPTGVFTQEGTTARGSFRSARGVHIIDILDSASEHLVTYGGHAAAAGATIEMANVDVFRTAAMTAVEGYKPESDPADDMKIDLQISADDITDELMQELAAFAPYGRGNPEPLFWITDLIVEEMRPVGKTGAHLKVVCKSAKGSMIPGIGFSLAKKSEGIDVGTPVEVLGHIRENTWNGNTQMQLTITEWRAL